MRAVAIVNGNARRLRDRQRAKLARALPGAVVFTHSLDEARDAIRAEVARGVDLIVLGGGDGTVVMGLVLIGEACCGAGRPEPAIGVLRLGSANAIADAVGASTDPAADLARLARGGGVWRPMRMLHVLGFRAPFVGMGVDAQVLEDRETLARFIEGVPGARRLVARGLPPVLGDAARSALVIASLARSSPSRVHAVISNLGSPALEMKRGGPTGRAIATGDTVWRGACTLVAGSTTLDSGFGSNPFAFAGARRDRFHLRCGDTGWLELLRGAPAAFRGDHSSERFGDFLCDRVQIQLDREVAISASGELLGRHRQLEIALGPPVIVAALEGDPR